MMNSRKWIKIWSSALVVLLTIGGFNYMIDPYDFYNNNFFNLEKTRQDNKIRLVKATKIKEIKPASICLGTSRADFGYNPNHPYFIQPAYNLGISAASMYEEKLFFDEALTEKRLKKVLLVLDFIMFNLQTQKATPDFETYFGKHNIYKYLFSYDQLKDSIFTILKINPTMVHLKNGMRKPAFGMEETIKKGKYLQNFIDDEKNYYKKTPINHIYEDTGKKSFPDFEYIVRKCYDNNITLDIIFGPSHIRQWEALNWYLGFNTWLKWKKEVVTSVNNIAKEYHKKQFKIMDFAVYHKLTSEKIPKKPNIKMKYYRESSHYTSTLGNIVLNRLTEVSRYKDFGIKLNLQNIDRHLKRQKINRNKFINVKKYQLEVFGEIKPRIKGN